MYFLYKKKYCLSAALNLIINFSANSNNLTLQQKNKNVFDKLSTFN